MGSKTYVSLSLSNVSGNVPESKVCTNAVVDSMLNDVNKADNLVHNWLLKGRGIRFKQYVNWARSTPVDGQGTPPYKTWLGLWEPVVYSYPQPSLDDILPVIKSFVPDFNQEEEEISSKEFKFKGLPVGYKDKEKDCIDVTVRCKAKKKGKYVLHKVQCSVPDTVTIGEAYVWKEEKYKEKVIENICTNTKTYQVLDASNMVNDEGKPLPSTSPFEVSIEIGYAHQEPHTRPTIDADGKLTTEDCTEEVFYPTEEAERLDTAKYLNQECGTNKGEFLVVILYTYNEYEIDAYERIGHYLQLDSSDKPIPIKGSTMKAFFPFESERDIPQYPEGDEGGEITFNKENLVFFSTANKEDIQLISVIKSKNQAKQDPLYKNIWKDPIKVELGFTPYAYIRDNLRWVSRDNKDNPEYKWQKKAMKKATGNRKYYDKVYDEIKKQGNAEMSAYIYYVFGVPANHCQYKHSARYALQFFKQIICPQYKSLGETPWFGNTGVTHILWGGRANFNFQSYWMYAFYQQGTGKCPADPKAKAGKIGMNGNYAGCTVFYRQKTDNYWEMSGVQAFQTIFANIANGKAAGEFANWWEWTWDKKKHRRNYSKCFIPVVKEVFKNMSLVHWTDASQFVNYVAVTAYKVVKEKWYQKGIFKVIIAIVVFVVTVVISFTTGGVGATIGGAIMDALLATASSFVVTVIANYLIRPLAVAVFGDTFGNIFADMFGTIVFVVGCFYFGGLSSVMENFTNPSFLSEFANGVFGSIQRIYQSKLNDIKKQTEAFNDWYKTQQDKIDEKSKLTAGFGMSNFWKNHFRNSVYSDELSRFGGFNSPVENQDKFLTRGSILAPEAQEINNQIIADLPNMYIDATIVTEV